MFNSLRGIITGKFPKQLFLENNGIEWDLCVPDSNLDMLPSVGSECKVYTWFLHTDTSMGLYGFSSNEERSLFLNLLKVDGVGPKGALKIMSSVSSTRLVEVLDRGDVDMLEKIPGVGKKTAGKMLLALKGKLSLKDDVEVVRTVQKSLYDDVIISLCSMGYEKNAVQSKIAELQEELNKDSLFVEKSQKEKEDILFKKAIVEMS